MAQDVSISYADVDHEFVSRLTLDLEDRGVDVWIDRMDVHAGEVKYVGASLPSCLARR